MSRASLIYTLLAPLLVFAQASQGALPPGFSEQTVVRPDGQAWSEAVGLAFQDSGRLFVWERGGSVWIVDPEQPVTGPFLDLKNEVAAYADHGLLGFALHPDFESTGFVYALFAVERHHLQNCDSPRTGPVVCGPGYVAGTHGPYNATIGRIVRFRALLPAGETDYHHAGAVDPASRTVLLGESWWYSDPFQTDPLKPRNTGCPILWESHGVGSLVFGQDGSLLASCGDGATPTSTDLGPGSDAYYSQALADGIILPKENVGAYRSQLVDSFGGKILRIDPATGDGIPGNPFFDGSRPRSAQSRVWALGLRNPYRFSLRPGTGSHDPAAASPGVFYVGDVGWNTWEDLNVVRVGGQNFGWPAFEGQEALASYYTANVLNRDAVNPLYNGTTCAREFFYFRELINQDTAGTPGWPNPCNTSLQITAADVFLHDRPALDMRHGQNTARFAAFNGNVAVAQPIGTTAPDGSTVLGSAFAGNTSTGGIWYTGTNFPAPYRNTYFHGDYGSTWIKSFVFDSNDVLKEVRGFGDNVGGVVSLAMHPQAGELYYIAWTAFVRRVAYTPTTNVPPVAVATADKTFGGSPLTVQFSGAQSSDQNGNSLTYSWNFGDGTATATGVSVTHVYTGAGLQNFTATLTVQDPGGLTSQGTLLIALNNAPPTVQITSPADGALYPLSASTTYPLGATLGDAQTGVGTLTCQWLKVLHHNSHTHQDPPLNSCSGPMVVSPVGCDGESYFYEARLRVTDPQGLSTQVSSYVYPNCNGIGDSTPPGAPGAATASAVGSSQINLSWGVATDNNRVTGYQVERCQGAGCTGFALLATVTGLNFNDTGLPAGTSYSYRVRATDAAGLTGPYTAVTSATTLAPPAQAAIRVNVGGPAYTDSAANLWSADTGFNTGNPLTWPASTAITGTSDPTLYRTERWDSPASPAMTYSVAVPNGTYQVKLHFAENYPPLFQVGRRVFDVQIEGLLALDNLDIYAQAGARTALIKTVTATVSDGQLNIVFIHGIEDPEVNAIEILPQALTPDSTPPGAPGTATASAVSSSQINLSWGVATDNIGVTGYQVERCQGAGCTGFSLLATVTGLGYSHTGLTASTSYSYRVRAIDAAGLTGPYTAVASATTQTPPPPDSTPPGAPGTATASAVSSSQINLGWGVATDNIGVTGYQVERCQGAGCTGFSLLATVTGLGYSNTGLTATTGYSYRVRATDAAGLTGPYTAVASATTLAPPAQAAIRVNVGGPAYTDSAANLWSADTGFNTGNPLTWPASTVIAGTSDPTLYRTERWDSPSAPAMTYSFTVPNGTYQVRLHFSEINAALFQVGQRVFDVQIEGLLALDNLDIYAQAGARAALIKTVTATVSDGQLNIVFIHGIEDPQVNAIEILPQALTPDSTPPGAPGTATASAVSSSQINLSWGVATDNIGVTGYQVERCQGAGCTGFALLATVTGLGYSNTGLTATTGYSYRVRAIDAAGLTGPYTAVASATTLAPPAQAAIRVNVGGPAYTDSAANLWSADTGFNTGKQLSWPASTAIAGTSDPTLYRTERWDSPASPAMTYSFTVPNGTYQVKLHFAENYPPLFQVGQRVFDVQVEGVLALDNLDIYAAAGARTALIKTLTTIVSDGQLNIVFIHGIEDPEVNAIEILRQ